MKLHPSAKPSGTSPSAPPVKRGDKQAECSRREHHPGGEAQQGVQGQCARAAKDEHGHPTAAWLAHEASLPAGIAKTRLAVSRKLRTTLPLVAASMA